MNETVLALVDAINSGDAIETENAFATAMAEKLSVKIDEYRQSVAASMFAQPEEVVEEEIISEEEYNALSEEEKAEYELVAEKVADHSKSEKTYFGTGNYMQNMVNKPSKPADPHNPTVPKKANTGSGSNHQEQEPHNLNVAMKNAHKATPIKGTAEHNKEV